MFSAQVAQLVEQRTENPRVGGSIPPLGTIFSLSFLIFKKFNNLIFKNIVYPNYLDYKIYNGK